MASKKDKKKSRSKNRSSGSLSNMRIGFKSLLGSGQKKKKGSILSQIVGYLLIAAAFALLIYRFMYR